MIGAQTTLVLNIISNSANSGESRPGLSKPRPLAANERTTELGLVAQENKLDGNAGEIVEEQEKEKTTGELVEAAEKLSKQISSKPLDSVADMTKEAKEKSRVKLRIFFYKQTSIWKKPNPRMLKEVLKLLLQLSRL